MTLLSREFWLSDTTHAVIAFFLLAIVTAAWLENFWRRRVIETGAANTLLDMHASALKELLESDLIGRQAKECLVQVQVLMASRKFASRVVSKLLQGSKHPIKRGRDPVLDEILAAEKSNSEFRTTLKKFIETGLLAMTLRWPETRGDYVKVTVKIEKETPERLAEIIESAAPRIDSESPHFGKLAPANG